MNRQQMLQNQAIEGALPRSIGLADYPQTVMKSKKTNPNELKMVTSSVAAMVKE